MWVELVSLKRKLLTYNSEADEFIIIGKEAYNLCHDRDASVFFNPFIEKVLGHPCRNQESDNDQDGR